MITEYSNFSDIYSGRELNGIEEAYKLATPWLLNNHTWIILILTALALAGVNYFKLTKPVAKNDQELINKYLLLRKTRAK